MKEIGGYIELDKYSLPMLHEGAIALNCGRNCLAYLIRVRQIKKILLPYFLCDSVIKVCEKENVTIQYYPVDEKFLPKDVELEEDQWLYLVNYYGQLSNKTLTQLKDRYHRVIVDNAQAYFQMPLDNTDTIYTCRKFFGVADGAFLYTDEVLQEELPQDESFERMHFVLGRFERTASEFYAENAQNNKFFVTEPIKRMSKLTDNLLHAIDYEQVKVQRTENYNFLYEQLQHINPLHLDKIEGAFAYPLLLDNGMELKKALAKVKIYIPTLWPNVLSLVKESELEYRLAKDILPIPCDQRYSLDDMQLIVDAIKNLIEGE